MANFDSLDSLVASVVGETHDAVIDVPQVDLTCSEVLTDEFILDDTASVKSKKCSQTRNGSTKFKNKDKTFTTDAKRILKRERLLPNDGDMEVSQKKQLRRDHKQKSSGRSDRSDATDNGGGSDSRLSTTSETSNDIGQSVSHIDGSDLPPGSRRDLSIIGYTYIKPIRE